MLLLTKSKMRAILCSVVSVLLVCQASGKANLGFFGEVHGEGSPGFIPHGDFMEHIAHPAAVPHHGLPTPHHIPIGMIAVVVVVLLVIRK